VRSERRETGRKFLEGAWERSLSAGLFDPQYNEKRREMRRSFAQVEGSALPPAWKREERKERALIRRFWETWLESGSHFEKWQKQNPDLDYVVRKALRERDPMLYPNSEVDGRAYIGWVRPRRPGYLDSPTWFACALFINLVTGDFYGSLCKCYRCGRYYLNTTRRRRKVYCSRRCGTAATAAESTRRRRQIEREAILHRVRAALSRRNRGQAASAGDWKTWVSEQAGVTRKFLTRAVNKGDVQAPVEKRRDRTSANL
jgi:hypothetical protein